MENNSKLIGLDCGSKDQIERTRLELEKSKKTLNMVNLSKLPDNGAKLINRIDELENLLKDLNLEPHTVEEDRCEVKNKDVMKSDDISNIVRCELRNELPKKCQNSDITNCVASSRTFEHAKSKKCSLDSNVLNKTDSMPFMTVKPSPLFSDLAEKNISKLTYENNESPSFTNWREPKGKILLTEAKPLIDAAGTKKCLNIGTKPFIDVNEESVKKIQHSLVTYPDDSLEEDDPENLKSSLMTHQRKALAWLIWREQQDPSGGVLADDMGLGKTITVISLILKQNENNNFKSELENKECKATLIVCLASVIHQWNDEIIKHCNQDALEVLIYHGPKRDRNFKNMRRYDVVLTTYNIIMSEKKVHDNSKFESPLFKLKWERIVLDEAHTIKNHSSLTAQAIFSLKGFRRWAVTGTPIHNVFKDMYSLIKFLQFSPFDDYKKFKKLTNEISESSDKRKNLLVKSIILRRTKEQVDEQGKPLIKMKSKTFSIICIELSDRERKIYDRLNEKTSKKFDQYFNNSKMKSSKLLVLLLRLQQCCSHICLLKENVEDDDDDISSDITKNLSSLTIDNASNSSSSESSLDLTFSEFDANNLSDISVKSSKILSLFEELNKISVASENKDKSVIVSQWVSLLDIISFHLKEENIEYYLIAGNTKAEDRQKFAEDFNTKDRVKVMLLSLKAGGVGLNLTGANHLFLLDLHWNPALEMQACDRIHRVGQEKDVTIHKFICKDTIEERILKLQDSKRNIAKSALRGVKEDTRSMTIEDFKSLFNVRK